MTTVILIHAKLIVEESPQGDEQKWLLTVEVSDPPEARCFTFTAPGDLTRETIGAYLEANRDQIVAWAALSGRPPDLFQEVEERALVRAVLELVVDQINVLRSQAGMAPITPAQARAALVQKLQEMR